MTVYCNCKRCLHNAEGKCKFKVPLQIGDNGKCLSYFEDDIQEFEEKYGYLLSWEDAEKLAGRRLDFYNNLDCSVYHYYLMEKVKKEGLI